MAPPNTEIKRINIAITMQSIVKTCPVSSRAADANCISSSRTHALIEPLRHLYSQKLKIRYF